MTYVPFNFLGMVPDIECFLPQMPRQDLERTLALWADNRTFAGASVLPGMSFRKTSTLKEVAASAKRKYILLYLKDTPLETGLYALDRFVSVAADTGADMLYSDYFERTLDSSGRTVTGRHPLTDCLEGSLRDDFDFGPVLVFRTASFRKAVDMIPEDCSYGALYALRLAMKRIVHIGEFLYTAVETDLRKSGEKQFDYVDPKNRAVQAEMEKICTWHLKLAGAYLGPESRKGGFRREEGYPVTASVIIPVLNRAGTVADAVKSALSQECPFRFNVLVVDNHSTDGTTDILSEIASADSRLLHIIPQKEGLGIGGCWNVALNHEACGEFAVQLDSDDVYSSVHVLERIVEEFSRQDCAMVIGSYLMTDFSLSPIPPGVIDHREWTDGNGPNNALRVNGLGAPRAFRTSVARKIGFPDTSYGEDYAMGLRISRDYRIGRIYDVLYFCRRWDGNSDAALSIEKQNANNLYKDRIRTYELLARKSLVRSLKRKGGI